MSVVEGGAEVKAAISSPIVDDGSLSAPLAMVHCHRPGSGGRFGVMSRRRNPSAGRTGIRRP